MCKLMPYIIPKPSKKKYNLNCVSAILLIILVYMHRVTH